MKRGMNVALPIVNPITYFLEPRENLIASAFFGKVPKNSNFSRHFQFYCNIVQNARGISLEKVIKLYNE